MRILIIGPDGKVGGVRTHVNHLKKILSDKKVKIKVTWGAQVSDIIKKKITFKPKIVIYNLSVYRNKIIRDIVTRTLLTSSDSMHIVHFHGGSFFDIPFSKNYIVKAILKLHFQRFDYIYCLTNAQYEYLTKYLGIETKIKKIYNYVEIPDERYTNKPRECINLLYIGRLHPLKGIMNAVEAIKKIESNGIRLWIIGTGELEKTLKNINDPRIVFLGTKFGSEKTKYLKKSHIFIFPSNWPEGLPYVLLEAASYGLVLISTKVGAVEEILKENRNGYFIEAEKIGIIAHKIQKLLNNPEEVVRMGIESRKICEEKFSIKNLERIYEKIIHII